MGFILLVAKKNKRINPQIFPGFERELFNSRSGWSLCYCHGWPFLKGMGLGRLREKGPFPKSRAAKVLLFLFSFPCFFGGVLLLLLVFVDFCWWCFFFVVDFGFGFGFGFFLRGVGGRS